MSNESAPVTKREIGSWCFYDFANSVFTTLIVTFIFSLYFARSIHGDDVEGAVMWTRAVNISALIVALTTPVLGAIADSSGRKKLFLLLATLQAIIFTVFLFFMGPGMATVAAVLFIIANVGFEGAQVFYNAFLPEISTPKNIGRISGYGWGLGYFGGFLTLLVALAMVSWLPEDGAFNVRSTVLLVAGWYAVFSVPIFAYLRERRTVSEAEPEPDSYVKEGFQRVADTFRNLRHYREAAKMLAARLIYNDGLVTIIAMAAIYTGAVYGMDESDNIKLGIMLNVGAAIGALGFGFVNDWIGGKWTIAITLVVLTAAGILGATSESRLGFWVAAAAISLMLGPNQSASRSLLGVFVPREKQGEFFGFFAFSGKLSSVAGPFVYGTILSMTGDHRLAMGSVVGFFVIGLIVLLTVDEKAGIEAAQSPVLHDVGSNPSADS